MYSSFRGVRLLQSRRWSCRRGRLLPPSVRSLPFFKLSICCSSGATQAVEACRRAWSWQEKSPASFNLPRRAEGERRPVIRFYPDWRRNYALVSANTFDYNEARPGTFRISSGKSAGMIFTSALFDGSTRIQTHMAPDPHHDLFRQGLSFVIIRRSQGAFCGGLALGIMHLTDPTPPVWSAGSAVPTPTFSAAPVPAEPGG